MHIKQDGERKERPHLLIYAHYYYPDVASTGQILKELAEGLLDTFRITVICAVPSYDGKVAPDYRKRRYFEEEINSVHIIRIRVTEFVKTNKFSRIRNIIHYFVGAVSATFRVGKVDYLFAISQPPILGGLIGVWGKWICTGQNGRPARLIYNIQDFNPEQIMATGYSRNRLLLKALLCLDKFSCRQADLVITVGRDLMETLRKRFPNKKVLNSVMINNWIDESAVYPLPGDDSGVAAFREKYGLYDGSGRPKFVIMYSGNIGLYYDLPNLVKTIKRFRKGYSQQGIYEKGPVTPDGREVVFAFVGDGSVLSELKAYSQRHHFENLIFIPYQDKDNLIYSLNAGDVHWCVNAKGIKGVSCPSKCYGIMAAGRPVLGVLEEGTEIRRLIEEGGCGLCCEPGDYNRVTQQIRWFIDNAGSRALARMGSNGRKYLVERLSREASIGRYKSVIREL